MAENTEHYNLVKPDYADAADVAQLNGNMDIIDGILWQLANAGADEELLKKVQEILDKIGETDDTGGSYVSGTVMGKINKSLQETESIGGNVDTLIRLLSYGVFEKSTAGSFTVTLPETVSKIKVTACGGGGGGAGSTSIGEGKVYCYSGGGGGQAIVEQEYEVEPGATLTGTVGAGGSPSGYQATDGGATIINGIVTLAGGKGGVGTSMSSLGLGSYAEAGGTGGGDAGAPYFAPIGTSTASQYRSQDGKDGIVGKGGKGAYIRNSSTVRNYPAVAGGGGGGSLGNGGNGAGASSNDSSLPVQNSTAGTRGGGGGGGGTYNSSGDRYAGKAGGTGYIKIVWGY